MGDYGQNRPTRIFQYLAVITGSLSIVTDGTHYGWTSASLPKLLDKNSEIPITKDQGSWIAVTILCGTLCGALLAREIMDRIGRKKVILLSSIPFFVAWCVIAFAKSFTLLIVARVLAGISDGIALSTLPIYTAEISDPKIRGLLGSSVTISLVIGHLTINVLGYYLTITKAALIASVYPLLLLLTFWWMPESPYYLVMKDKLDQARHSLKKLRGMGDVEHELNRLRKSVQERNLAKNKWTDLFKEKVNRKALLITVGVRATQLFSGFLTISFYLQTIFKEAGEFSSILATVIYLCVSMVAAIFSSVIIDKAGRRPLLLISITGSGLALLIEGCYFYVKDVTGTDTSAFGVVPVVALIAFIIVFNIGLYSIPFILISELFSTNLRALASCFNTICFCVLCVIVSKFFQFTKDSFGMHVPFFAFAACCGFGLIFTIFYVPETKGKTLEQIQDELLCDVQESQTVELQAMFQKQ